MEAIPKNKDMSMFCRLFYAMFSVHSPVSSNNYISLINFNYVFYLNGSIMHSLKMLTFLPLNTYITEKF